MDFLLVLIDLFSLGVTAEMLLVNIDWKSAFSLQQGQFDLKFQVEAVDGMGPVSYLVMAADLRPIDNNIEWSNWQMIYIW